MVGGFSVEKTDGKGGFYRVVSVCFHSLEDIGLNGKTTAIHQLNPLDAKNARAAVQTLAEVTVSVVHPEPVGGVSLEEPGYTMAYTEAPIYAQTSGYLKKWYFDIGGKG